MGQLFSGLLKCNVFFQIVINILRSRPMHHMLLTIFFCIFRARVSHPLKILLTKQMNKKKGKRMATLSHNKMDISLIFHSKSGLGSLFPQGTQEKGGVGVMKY